MQVYLRSTSLLLVPPCFHAITAPEIHKENVQKSPEKHRKLKNKGSVLKQIYKFAILEGVSVLVTLNLPMVSILKNRWWMWGPLQVLTDDLLIPDFLGFTDDVICGVFA